MNNEDIIKVVSDAFGVSDVRMSSKDRSNDVTIAKIAYCGLTRKFQKATTINVLLGISAPSIRKYVKQCEVLVKFDNDFAKKYNKAKACIEQGLAL